eukprot:gene8019-9864_t
MLKQTIKKWNQSLDSYKGGNVNEAISLLSSVDPTSKVLYNLGVMNIRANNLKSAIDCFTRSVQLDKYLAISYFMRGVAHHKNGETSHAIVDYDESIHKLRGHEYIDYRQLGLEYKLLLTEILFNKALALGKAGSSVATQASQCSVLPDDPDYRNQCARLQEGQSSLGIRLSSLDVLFKPPKVTDGPSSTKSDTAKSAPNPVSSSTPTPSYGLKLSSSPSPQLPIPPKPRPALPSPSSSSESSYPPKPPPPLPSKKLPSRPISMAIQEMKITIKVFYNDRRLIQIPAKCTFSTLKQKIELKFQIIFRNNITINFKSPDDPDQMIPIRNQKDLDYALGYELQEIYIIEKNEELEEQEEQEERIQPPILVKPLIKPKYNTIGRDQSIPSPTPSTTSVNKFGYLSSSTSTTPSQPMIPPRKISQSAPTLKSSPSSSPTSNYSYSPPAPLSSSPGGAVIPPRPIRNPPPFKKPSTTATTSSTTSEEIPYPYKACYSPTGDKFYLNTETGDSVWQLPN